MPTEEINEWIALYGCERDALNVALAKLSQAKAEMAVLKEDIQDLLHSIREDSLAIEKD